MKEIFSKLLYDLCYTCSLNEIKIENEKRSDLSYNSSFYRKIICKDSGHHTISSIAKLLSVQTTAVTQKVNELEKKNYVYRKQSETDKRISYLYAVEKHCPCAAAIQARDFSIYHKLEEEYSQEDLARFLEILERMNTHYLEFDSKNGG